MGIMKVFITVFIVVSIVAAGIEADVLCETALNNLLPCFYLAYHDDPISQACCNGLGNIKELGSTPSDKKAVCYCLRRVLHAYLMPAPPDYLKLIPTYPRRCGVNLPYQLNPYPNCTW